MWLSLLIFILSVPTGFLIAWMARDELVIGRRWFLLLGLVSIVVGVVSIFYNLIEVMWTCSFIIVVCLISYLKSYNRKWTRKK